MAAVTYFFADHLFGGKVIRILKPEGNSQEAWTELFKLQKAIQAKEPNIITFMQWREVYQYIPRTPAVNEVVLGLLASHIPYSQFTWAQSYIELP